MNHIPRVIGVYNSDEVSSENSLNCMDVSRTRQEFKDESDINTIITLFGLGENPVAAQKWVSNVDITDAVNDYQTALNQIIAADRQFSSLPARIRSQFENNPAKFVDFVSDSGNIDELVRLGLAVKRDPIPVPVVEDLKPAQLSS